MTRSATERSLPGGDGIAASSRNSFKAWEVCTYLIVSCLQMSFDAHIPTAAEPLIQASLLGEAVDPGPVAIFVADEQMRYVAVNAYAAELLGYTRAELLELRVTDVARTPEATEQFDEVVAHRQRDGIALLTRKNGSVFQLGYRARETTVAGMPLYVSVGWPI